MMDRPPVTTEKADKKIEHRVWPCVPHPPEVDCVDAQEAYLRAKNRITPVRRA